MSNSLQLVNLNRDSANISHIEQVSTNPLKNPLFQRTTSSFTFKLTFKTKEKSREIKSPNDQANRLNFEETFMNNNN